MRLLFLFGRFFCFSIFLGFSHFSFAENYETLDSFYEALQKSGKKIKTFQASLTQTKKLKLLSKALISKGKIAFKKENQVRWEILEPEKSTIWIQEKKMWCFFPEFNQCEVYFLENLPIAKNNPSTLFLGVFQDLKTFQKSNKVEFKKEETLYQLKITPRQKKQQLRQILLKFEKETLYPKQISFLYKNGDQSITEFDKIEVNKEINAKIFQPNIPANTEIIEIKPQ